MSWSFPPSTPTAKQTPYAYTNTHSSMLPETIDEDGELPSIDDDGDTELVVPETPTPEPMVPAVSVDGFDDLADINLTYKEWKDKYVAKGLLHPHVRGSR